MRSFTISIPVITILDGNEETKSLIDCQLTLIMKIKDFELTSSSLSKCINQNQICWEEIFSFTDISKQQHCLQFTVLKNATILFSFTGDLNFDENQNIFESKWNQKKVTIKFNLTQFLTEQNKNQVMVESLNLNFEENNHVQLINKQQIQTQQQKQNQQEIKVVNQCNVENQLQENEIKRRHVEQELQLADRLYKQRQNARVLSRQQIRKMSNKVLKEFEETKFEENTLNLKKKEQKESKPVTDRNKQNKQSPQKLQRTIRDENQNTMRTTSPKESLMKSQSFAKSMIIDEVRMFRTKYGDKIYENQSATTMQKSILCFSVPKGPRFKHLKYNGVQPSYYVGTSFSSKNKGTSFGYGTRKPYPQWMVRNMTQNPAPNMYSVSQPPVQPTTSSKGFSFGISYKYYQKAGIIGTQSSRKSINKPLPKISKPLTANRIQLSSVDSNSHYHYRNR